MLIDHPDGRVSQSAHLPWWYWAGSLPILALLAVGIASLWGGTPPMEGVRTAPAILASSLLLVAFWALCGRQLRRAGSVAAQPLRPEVDPGLGLIERDVTALAAAEARLRHVQEIAGIGEWLWDMDAGQMTWSEQIYRI